MNLNENLFLSIARFIFFLVWEEDAPVFTKPATWIAPLRLKQMLHIYELFMHIKNSPSFMVKKKKKQNQIKTR